MKNYYQVPVITILLFNCFSLFSNANASGVLPNRNKPETRPQNASLKVNPVPKTARKMDCGIPAPTIVNYGCLDKVWTKDYKQVDNRPFLQFGENPIKVYKTPDGGYVFASASQFQPSNSGSTDLWVVKVDANGKKVWSKIFGTTSADSYTSFVKTSDGGYLLGGSNSGGIGGARTSANKGLQDAWIIKIDANGNKVWDKSFGGIYNDYLTSIISTSDNGFLLGINSESPQGVDKSDNSNGLYDTWIIKLDANGNKVWDKSFGGDQTETVRALSETSDGYLLASNSNSGISGSKSVASKGGYDMWVLKMDFDGNKIWDNVYGGTGADASATINKDSDGSFLLGGTSNSPIGDDKTVKSRGGFTDIWLVKISASGTKLWDRTIGGNQYETLTSVTTTTTGSFIVNLKSNSPVSGDKNQNPGLTTSNPYDLWLFEISSNGTKLWEKIMVGSSQVQSGDLLIDGNNLMVLGGPVYGETPQFDFWNVALRKISYCQPQSINSTTICQKKCTVLTANDCASGVVKWSNGQYGVSICASPNTTQNYKAVCLSADSTCVGDSSAVFTVNVNAIDNLSVSPTGYTAISCGQSQTITATGCANGVIHWTGGLTGNSITVTPVKDRAYKATCTTPNGCTTDSLAAWFTVDRLNVPSSTIQNNYSHNRTVCVGKSVTLIGNDLGGISGWTGGVQGSTLTITPTVNTVVKYFATRSDGCSFPADSDYVYINVVPVPVQPTVAKYSCLNKIWDKRFGGSEYENFKKTIKLSDGYLLAGTSTSSVSGDRSGANRGTGGNTVTQDYWIVKIDNNGNKVWDKTFGGNYDDNLSNVIQLTDGSFMLVGSSNSGIGGDKSEASRGGTDYWIVKIDANGNKLWDKTFGGSGDENPSYYSSSSNVDIRETSDGFILGGISISGVSGDKTLPAIKNGYFHFWVLKLDAQGSKVWDKTFGGINGTDLFVSLESLPNDEFVLLGTSESPASTTVGNKTSDSKGGKDYWLIKIDANGNKIWDKSYGGLLYGGFNTDIPKSMVVTNDGKITIAGKSNAGSGNDKTRNNIGGNSNSDIWLIRVNTDGDKIWDKTYGTYYGSEEAKSINTTNQGRYIVSGTTTSAFKGNDFSQDLRGYQYSDYWIMELDASGEKLWDKSFGGSLPDDVANVIVENNSLIISGTSFSGISHDKSQPSQGNSDYWLIKTSYCTPDVGNSTTICKNDSVLLAVQGCANGNTVQWKNLNDYQTQVRSVKPSVTTTYKVVCVGIACASDTASYTINVNTTPIPTITPSSTTISCQAGSSATLTASGCAGTYGWSSGATTSSIVVSPNSTRTYKVACTANSCTSDSAFVTITVLNTPAKPSIFPGFVNVGVCLGNSVQFSIPNPVSGCTYTWTGGLSGTSVIVTPTVNSSYKAVCTQNGCVSDSSTAVSLIILQRPATPPIINSISSTPICPNSPITLSINNPLSTTNNNYYFWTGGLSGTSITVSPATTKSYKALLRGSNYCYSDSSTAVTVNVQPKPIVILTPSTSSPICSGQSITIVASGCSTGTYAWTGGLTGTSITVNPTTNRTYKSACTLNGCASDSASVTITIAILNKPTLSPSTQSICLGASATITASGCAGGTYSWTGGLTGTSILVSPTTTKSYKAVCTIGTCVSDSSLVSIITVNPVPSIPVINPQNSAIICAGNSVLLSVNNPLAAGTYRWTGGLSGTSISVTPTISINYRVNLSVNNCASDSSTAVTVTVQPKPIVTLSPSTSSPICVGQSITITASGCSTGTYAWTGGLTGTSITVSPSTNKIYKSACTLNGCVSDSASVSVSVSQSSPLPTTTASSVCQGNSLTVGNGLKSTAPNCSGGASNVTATYSGGVIGYDGNSSSGSNPTAVISGMSSTITKVRVSITWHKKGGSGNAFSCTNGTSTNPYHNETSFRVQAPDGTIINLINSQTYDRGSTSSLVTTVFEDGFPAITSGSLPFSGTFSAASALSGFNGKVPNGTWTLLPNDSGSGDPLCVSGFSVTITTSGSASTITWWDAQTGGNQIGTGTEYLPTTNTLQAGTYTYYAQTACAGLCPSARVGAVLTVNAKPNTPSISTNNSTICSGSNATLTASGCTGGTFSWTGGLTGTSITITPTATKSYKVACTVSGCVSDSSAATVINVTNLSGFGITSNKSSVCVGDTATLTATGCTGTLSWSNNLTTNIIKVTPQTTTNYTATCTVGLCSFTQQISISTVSAPNITAPTTSLLCGQTITLTANNIPTGSAIQWRKDGVDISGATGNTYSANSGGGYDFTSYKFTNINTSIIGNGLYPNTVIYFTDKNIGFVGNGEGIFKTGDAGITWTRVYNSANKIVNSISFINATIGWAVGENGLCLKTIDGGNTWTSVSINTYSYFRKILFKDLNNGVIVGGFGEIFYTINGGTSWIASSITTASSSIPTYQGVTYTPNSSNVYAVGASGSNTIYVKSTDNGITWSESSLGISQTPPNTVLNDITFTTINNGFIVGDNGTIFKTINGGTNWQLQISPISSSLRDIQFLNGQVGYICGTFPNGSLLKTTDGGNNWKSLTMGAYPVSLSFVDENTGWLTNYGSVLQYTAPQCSPTPITIVNNCCQTPIPTIAPTNPTICTGGNVTLTASGCAGTYTWTGGLTGTSITVSVAKTYKVTCRMNNCNSDSASANVTTTNISPPIVDAPSANCNLVPVKVWDKTISMSNDDEVRAIISTSDGGTFSVLFSVAGTSKMVKLSSTGTTQWSRDINAPSGFSEITSVVATSDGGYLLGGKNNSSAIGGDVSSTVRSNPSFPLPSANADFWILKIDANGVRQWDKRYGGYMADELKSIIKTSTGYLLGGVTRSDVGGDVSQSGNSAYYDFWTVKIDNLGNKLWDKRFNRGLFDNNLTAISNTADGGFILGGYGRKEYDPNNPYSASEDFVTIKINDGGALVWSKSYDNLGRDDQLKSIQLSSDGGFIMGGNSQYGNSHIWILKINAAGTKQWDRQLGGTGVDLLGSMIPIPGESNFLLGASSSSPQGGDKTDLPKNTGLLDMWIIKMKDDGTKIWDRVFGGDSGDLCTALCVNQNNNITLGGSSISGVGSDKSQASSGLDSWIISTQLPCPRQTSAIILLGDSLTITASGCTGTTNWSNGQTGSIIVVKPTVNTSYTAMCTNVCTSNPSTIFNVTVSTGICESIKSGSWDDPATWSCNRVPLSTDDVIINSSHTVSTPATNIFAKTLTYRGGVLQTQNGTNLKLGN